MHSGDAASYRRCWDEMTGPRPCPCEHCKSFTAGPICRRQPNRTRARVTWLPSASNRLEESPLPERPVPL